MTLLTLLYSLSLAVSPTPQRVDFGTCPLRGGGIIEDCHLEYQWFGAPNANASNVIVVPSWFLGTSEAAGSNHGPWDPGWTTASLPCWSLIRLPTAWLRRRPTAAPRAACVSRT